MQPVILVRIGYGYIVVQIGREVICILIFGLALFFPIYAAHLQDDKCGLAFTRFMELRPPGGKKPGGKKGRKGRNGANMTLEEAEGAAAREGLVLVPSKKGYKGVRQFRGTFRAISNEKVIGNYATPYQAALEYARHIGPQQAAAEKATAMARRPTLLETAAGSITGVLAIARTRKPKN